MTLRDQIDNIREERLVENEALSAADAEAILEFSDELFLRKSDYSDARHVKLLRHCVLMAEGVGGLAAALEDRDAAEEIVRWVNAEYDNEETNRDYRVALRVFGRHCTDGDEPPDSIAWISSSTSRNYDPSPEPRNMLHWEEHIIPMIEATHNNRDAAMIAVAWDSGARSGEFRSLEVGDVTDHKHGLQVTVGGKTGKRTITLIPSVPYLNQWLADHPAADNRSAPLWSRLHSADDLTFNGVKKVFTAAADRAGVDRPVTLTNFRKSSASYLASEGMNQAHIEEHHGWVRGSRVAARYVSVFGDAAENELAQIHGLDVVEDESEPIGPVICPRCDKQTPRDREFCVWCEQAIEPGAVETLKTDERTVQRLVMRLAKDNPEILESVGEREAFSAILEDNATLQRQVRRFRDALDEPQG